MSCLACSVCSVTDLARDWLTLVARASGGLTQRPIMVCRTLFQRTFSDCIKLHHTGMTYYAWQAHSSSDRYQQLISCVPSKSATVRPGWRKLLQSSDELIRRYTR